MLLFRVSFTGELGFEINVPADFGLAVWEAVHHQGRAHGITAYGTETMHVLRAEKGYIIIGQDTDGTVTPDDAGLSWAVGKNKSDFVGKRSLDRAHEVGRSQTAGRPAHQGPADGDRGRCSSRREGAAKTTPMELIGHVTSSYASSVLEHSIALAMIAGGRARLGQTLLCSCRTGTSKSKSHRPCSTIRRERAFNA